MENNNWEVTTNRFVAFFDILGFKDLVNRNSHQEIINKLLTLKKTLYKLEKDDSTPLSVNLLNHTKSVTFSDSIIIFSKGNTKNDSYKIIRDSYYLLKSAINNGISIKGAISYGEITADFNNNLFFGQALIDSYLLHEDLEMINVIVDHNAENQILKLKMIVELSKYMHVYNTPMKYGKVKHKILRPRVGYVDDRMKSLTKLYKNVSGRPRKYIDNTIEFLGDLKSTNQK